MDQSPQRRERLPRASRPPTNAVTLQPNSSGHVAVETESGSISCLMKQDWVGCETPASNWPLHDDGTPYHSVIGNANGSIEWADGQMGDLPRTKLDRGCEYHALGWTIAAIEDGLSFTNDRTNHGFCVTTATAYGF